MDGDEMSEIEYIKSLLAEAVPGYHRHTETMPHPQYGWDTCMVCGQSDPTTLQHKVGKVLIVD